MWADTCENGGAVNQGVELRGSAWLLLLLCLLALWGQCYDNSVLSSKLDVIISRLEASGE